MWLIACTWLTWYKEGYMGQYMLILNVQWWKLKRYSKKMQQEYLLRGFNQRRWKYYRKKYWRILSGFALILKVTIFCKQAHFLSLQTFLFLPCLLSYCVFAYLGCMSVVEWPISMNYEEQWFSQKHKLKPPVSFCNQADKRGKEKINWRKRRNNIGWDNTADKNKCNLCGKFGRCSGCS